MILSRHDEDVLRDKAHEIRERFEDDKEMLEIADKLEAAANSGSVVEAAMAASLLVRKDRQKAPITARRFLNG